MSSDDAWIGHVIDGRYRLDARVAEGGFGTVYRGFHLGFERPVAVKLLRVEAAVAAVLGDGRHKLVANLRAEGAVLQRLSTMTVGTVQALDVGETTSTAGVWAPYLVLEWVDGEQLATFVVRRGAMSLQEATALLDPVARALEAAHSLGIAHRDVKPGNVLVTQVGSRTQTKLLDFGVAKVMTDAALERARAVTNLSFLGFTPAWGAPEQFDPSLGHTGAWTDVYSLALVLASLLSGLRPYGENRLEIAVRALDRERRPTPRALGVSITNDAESVFARALAIDPRNRPSSVGELWTALQQVVDATARTSAPAAAVSTAPHTVVTGEAAVPPSVAETTFGAPSAIALLRDRAIADDFRLVREISRGGMGAVYLAEQLSTGKARAVKLMHPSLVANARLRERFEQEARVASRIASEHVVDVIGAGVDTQTGMPWLAMELLEGEDLASYAMRSGPLPLSEVLDIFEQLCHAVGAAHRAGVVHRDLKPDNIFLAAARHAGSPFTVKVLDFGIAKVIAEAKAATTASVGTPLWMAPEQADARAPIGPTSDVWSLGLIAFRLLTGASYWQAGNETNPSSMRVISEMLFGPLPRASDRARELRVRIPPAGFDDWFARCIDRDPGRRFADAHELYVAMRAGLATGLVPAHWRASTEPMGGPPPPPSPPALQTEPMAPLQTEPMARLPHARSLSPRGNGFALTVGAIALVAIGWGGWKLVQPETETSTSEKKTSTDHSDKSPPPKKKPAKNTPNDPPPAMPLIRIPGGLGIFGVKNKDPENTYDEEERTEFVASFFIDKYETSVAEYRACVEDKGACSEPKLASAASESLGSCNFDSAHDDEPVNCVTFSQAASYCTWAGKRLPTYREWEFAARGVEGRAYPWGATEPTCLQAAYGAGGCSHAGPVPARAPTLDLTPDGVAQLAGNVIEWTDGTITLPTKGVTHAAFGGSWSSAPNRLRAFRHFLWLQQLAGPSLGFRCARTE